MDGEQIFDYVMDSPENTNPSVLRSVINSAKELPDVSGEDEGKVLTVNDNGKWTALEPESGLPSITANDSGKVLGVINAGPYGSWSKVYPNKHYFIGATYDGQTINSIISPVSRPVTGKAIASAMAGGEIITAVVQGENYDFYVAGTNNYCVTITFLSVSRNAANNATIYKSFSIDGTSETEVTSLTFTTKTINDPA